MIGPEHDQFSPSRRVRLERPENTSEAVLPRGRWWRGARVGLAGLNVARLFYTLRDSQNENRVWHVGPPRTRECGEPCNSSICTQRSFDVNISIRTSDLPVVVTMSVGKSRDLSLAKNILEPDSDPNILNPKRSGYSLGGFWCK